MSHRNVVRSVLVVALAAAPLAAAAQQPAAKGPPAPPNCSAAEFHQFDFWVGSWDVAIPAGHAGTNDVTAEEDGCLVHEHWKSVRAETGQSFNFYNRLDRRWHQVWVSNSGGVLDLAGDFRDSTLTFTGQTRRPDGVVMQHRLAFTKNGDGTVRQFWETSTDAGGTWQVAWDGRYTRRPAH